MVNVYHLNKNLDDILKLAVEALRPQLDHAISKTALRTGKAISWIAGKRAITSEVGTKRTY